MFDQRDTSWYFFGLILTVTQRLLIIQTEKWCIKTIVYLNFHIAHSDSLYCLCYSLMQYLIA